MNHLTLRFPASLSAFILSVLFRSFEVLAISNNQLADPCQFPSPALPDFSALCQFDYHQVPYLCDPSAMLSRTEADILDRHVRSRYNVTGCACAGRSGDGTKCAISRRKDAEGKLRVAVVLVPYSTVANIEFCVRRRNTEGSTDSLRNADGSSAETYAAAASAYARQIYSRWASAVCDTDMMLVYIGAWNPHMIRIPVAVRLFRRNLERLGSTPHVARVSDSESAFETVWSELQSAMTTIDPSKDTDDAKLLKSGSGESVSDGVVKERHRRKGTLHWGGIPIWAVFVSAGCLSLVAVMVYIGNCVTKRFNIRQQQKKYTAGTMRLANERWRSTDGGGGSPPNVGGGGNINANGSSAPQNTKSSMMFRQFNTGTKKQRQSTNQVQKI